MNPTTGPDPEANSQSIAPNPLDPSAPNPTFPPPMVVCRRKHWLRYIYDTNPFYLMSAALLLYGVHLVSNGSNTFTRETTQLAFNFGALQFYGVLLVATAIMLVRRHVWYDSTLLVCLENALVLVPFVLVTQAALIEQRFVWGYCAAGLLFAALRFASLRHWFHQLNLPARALGCGAVVLAVNAALPVVFRHLHESKVGTKPTEGAAYEFNHWCWLLLLPLLISLANLFPKPLAKGEHEPQKRWLPMFFFTFWIVATVTHLYSLGYVYDFDLRSLWLAPALWALTWSLYLRITDFVASPGWRLNRTLNFLPVLMPLWAGVANSKITFTLALLNVGVYGVSSINGLHPRLARNLAMTSVLVAVAALPHVWGAWLVPGFTPLRGVGIAILLAMVLPALLSRRAEFALTGGIAVGIAVGMMFEPVSTGMHWGAQAGFVFFLLHSLCWDDASELGLSVVRWVMAAAWTLHAFIWAHLGGSAWGLAIAGGIVLGAVLAARHLGWVRGLWGVGTMAGLVAVSSPLDVAGRWVVAAPAGLLAVAASLGLFAIGTAVALNKRRVHQPVASTASADTAPS